jgi:DNA-directed RNA polymerase specialized sigma24 family protein
MEEGQQRDEPRDLSLPWLGWTPAAAGGDMEQEDGRVRESELIARSANGDDPFERLLDDHVDEVWKLAFHLLPDHHEAEDVVHDTFVRARRGLHGFRGDCPFRSYLLTICRNRCRDILEKRRRREREVSWDGPAQGRPGRVDGDEQHPDPASQG